MAQPAEPELAQVITSAAAGDEIACRKIGWVRDPERLRTSLIRVAVNDSK